MKDYKYKTTFQAQAEIVKPNKKNRETLASIFSKSSHLEGLAGLFPSADEIENSPDLLFFTCNAATPNFANLNHDLVLGQEGVNLLKSVKYKQVNLEHNRDSVVGVLIGGGISSFDDSKLITRDESLASNKKFNLSVMGCIFRVAAGELCDSIEDSSDPESENYKKISVSWEIGFSSYGVLIGSKEVSDGIVKMGEDAKPYYKYLRAEGGAGMDDNGLEVYRIIEDPIFLGIGLTTNPAAAVSGILTYKEKMETEEESKSEDMEDMPESPEVETETPEEPEIEDEEDEKTKVKVEIEIEVEAADNKGKTLNKPFRLPSGSNKKFGVYVKNDKGNVVMVKFGDPNMEIKRDDPERRKAYRARHSCDTPGPKWKANYWSCRMWSSKPVSSIASVLDVEEWDGETEFDHNEIISICPEFANAEIIDETEMEKIEASEKNIKKDEKIISTFQNTPVIKPVTKMKFTSINEIYASLEASASDISAKEMREFLEGAFSQANEQYLAEKAAKAEAENKLQETLANADEAKVKADNLESELNELKASMAAKEAQDTFDKRFGALAETYDLTDEKVSAFVAKSIKDLDEEGFAHWKDNDGLVVLASRENKKADANIDDATDALKEAKANIDIPNAQELDKKEESFLSLANEIAFKLKK